MQSSYYKDKKTVEEYIKMAENVDGSFIISKLDSIINSNSSILEIGSGPGSDWEILNKNHYVLGSDYSEEFIKILEHKFPKGAFTLIDAISIETEKKFDCIYSNKVLQHLTNSEITESIENQIRALNKEGVICHTFWNGTGDEIFKDMYVNYQTLDSLNKLFSPMFEIIELQTYKEFDDDDSIYLIAKRK